MNILKRLVGILCMLIAPAIIIISIFTPIAVGLMISCDPAESILLIAPINNTMPYTAAGAGAKWFSPIQLVAKGMSDSQNNR